MSTSASAVRDGWIALLNQYSWDWFVTVTFKNQFPHPEAADKKWRLWCSKLNRELHGPRWYKKKKEIHWVRCIEHHKSGCLHFHALMFHPDNLNVTSRRMSQVDELYKIAGHSRIYPPRSNEAVAKYCAKYITKGGDLDTSRFLPSLALSKDTARAELSSVRPHERCGSDSDLGRWITPEWVEQQQKLDVVDDLVASFQASSGPESVN